MWLETASSADSVFLVKRDDDLIAHVAATGRHDSRTSRGPTRTGGEILVANLVAQGATHAFCVPGESYLAVLDALHDVRDRLQLIVCRQEGGAAYMAEAYGKLTGRPGIAFVTRGPGATNAAIGIHTAAQDSTPMIVFVGQVGSDFVDREAFQEIDYRRMYGSVAKWVAQIDRAGAHSRIRRARLSRRDVRAARARSCWRCPRTCSPRAPTCADAPRVERDRLPRPRPRRSPRRARCSRRHARPLVLVGGSRWDRDAVRRARALRRSAARCRSRARSATRTCSTTGIRTTPATSASASIRSSRARVRDADVLLVIGERLGEMTTARLHAARRRRCRGRR